MPLLQCLASSRRLKMIRLFSAKYHHVTHTASIGTILLPQVGFRLKEQIIERIASKTLTDQLLALAPSISYEWVSVDYMFTGARVCRLIDLNFTCRFWRKCSEAYAYQLLEKKYPLAAIPYFLASHKVGFKKTNALNFIWWWSGTQTRRPNPKNRD